MTMLTKPFLLALCAWAAGSLAVPAPAPSASASLEQCPGYKASNVRQTRHSLTADLKLAGKPCNTYGKDLENLVLKVSYDTDTRLHVQIYDRDEEVYQVPESVFPRPKVTDGARRPALKFDYTKNPFSFKVSRRDTGEVLFDSSASNLVFQSQYVRLRTELPQEPNLYGLGEHSDPLRLPTDNYTRTIWNRDSYGIPERSNLYGTHPIYVDHRGKKGTHGVFLLNSNGMDIKINRTTDGQQYLEYNTIGGIIDLYFFAGPSPKDVAKQYAEVAGLPAMQPYWGFGFHQCRYGYRDIFDVAEVVYNYSQAGIPLETMWTDIDYMYRRRTFTNDPERFPLPKIRALVDYLHDHDQHYIVMTDPAMSKSDNPAYNRGSERGIFLKDADGSEYEGVVWPGVTVYPDWFNPDTQDWWTNEFSIFYNRDTGIDIDGLWIDMNEPANFCDWPCEDPEQYVEDNDLPPAPPPVRENPRPLPGFPDVFQPPSSHSKRASQSRKGKKIGLEGRDLLTPPYAIQNEYGPLSQKTIDTDLVHAGEGYVEYDVHSLYGTMMSMASRVAMLARRPTVRPLVITRSTFAGAGAHVGHWLGDNLSTWEHYRISIAQMLAFASIFQIPMVGSDVCGFGGNVTETLCARWAQLGAFYPFFRNHNEIGSISQEFYRWETTTEAAKKAIDIRYRLLDYAYTQFHHQTVTGEPWLQPLFYVYPNDPNTYGIDTQFFYGDSILVSPVTDEDATSVDAYFPDDLWYDWYTGKPLRGQGKKVTLDNIDYTTIPIHIRGGSIIPVRASSANTTTALRKKPFHLIIAPGRDGSAKGSLYLDDGNSLHQKATLELDFYYKNGLLRLSGKFGFNAQVNVESITLLGQKAKPKTVKADNADADVEFNGERESVTIKTKLSLDKPVELTIQ